MRAASALAILCTVLAAAGPASAAVHLVPLVASASPLYVTHAGDSRLFVVEQAGLIRIYDRSSGAFLPIPFLDIRSKIASGPEFGLYSMAFHPDYASNGYFYVNYFGLAHETVIERYRVGANPSVADPNSAATLLRIPQTQSHYGGQLQIGPLDGYLYVAMGDGDSGGDPLCNAQRPDLPYGKMLRLDVRQNLNAAPFYGIPPSNPFRAAGDPGGLIPDEVWAFGFRNPWRFSFDRANGDLYIGDVGQELFEEIDLHRAGVPGGENFGWKVMEGLHCYDRSGCAASVPICGAAGLTLPVYEYPHAAGGDCSITGGYRYRGSRTPELGDRYVFGDFCTGKVNALREVSPGVFQSETLLAAGFGLTSFGEGVDGELYATVGNQVFQLVSDTPVPALGRPGWLLLAAGLAAVGLRARRMWRAGFTNLQ